MKNSRAGGAHLSVAPAYKPMAQEERARSAEALSVRSGPLAPQDCLDARERHWLYEKHGMLDCWAMCMAGGDFMALSSMIPEDAVVIRRRRAVKGPCGGEGQDPQGLPAELLPPHQRNTHAAYRNDAAPCGALVF